MKSKPHIIVFILNWNGEQVIKECLNSVLKSNYPNFSVTVIDNYSQDKSVKLIKEFFLDVEIIEISKNLGFGKG